MEKLFSNLQTPKKPQGRAIRRSSMGKKLKMQQQEIFNLNILRYQKFQTLKLKKDEYIECDQEFIHDVKNIATVKQDIISNIMQFHKVNAVTAAQCDEIDFKARLHLSANTVNSNSAKNFRSVDSSLRCDCGCQMAKGEDVPICNDQQTLHFLGPGVILHFMHMKLMILILIMIALVYGSFALATNVIGSSADLQICSGSYCVFQKITSNENKINPGLTIVVQGWLGLLFSIFWLLWIRLIKHDGKRKNQLIDLGLNSASDRAIKVSNLPNGQYSENQLVDYLDRLFDKIQEDSANMHSSQVNNQQDNRDSQNSDSNRFNIKSIQVIYNMEFSRKMVQEIFQQSIAVHDLLKEDRKGNRNVVVDAVKYKNVKNNLKQTYQVLKDLRKKFLNDSLFRKGLSSTCCILEFENQRERNLLLKHFGKEKIGIIKQLQQTLKKLLVPDSKGIVFLGNILKIERAPEPSDLIWQNCEKSFSLRRISTIYLCTFLIVLVSFGIYTGLDFLQSSNRSQDGTNNMMVISLIMAVILQVINKFIWFTLFYLLELEYNHTLTDKIISQMNKTLFSSSVNVIVLPLVSAYFIRNKIYGADGVNGQAFDFQLSFLAVAVVQGLNPGNMIKRFILFIRKFRNGLIRWHCGRVARLNIDNGVQGVNELYEGSQFDIAQNYVTLMGAIYHAMFFCHLQPAVLFLVIIMSTVFYWASKYKLLRTCKIPEITDYLVFETALSQANMVPIVYGVGSIVLSYIEHLQNPELPTTYISSSLCIALGLLVIGNPGDIFNKMINCTVKLLESKQVEELEEASALEINRNSLGNNVRKGTRRNSMMANCLDTYFEDSNSLTLLGFEATLRGQPLKNIMDQLKKYCQSFFEDTHKQIIRNAAIALLFGTEKSTKSKPCIPLGRPEEKVTSILKLPSMKLPSLNFIQSETVVEKQNYTTRVKGYSSNRKVGDS